MCPSPEMNWTTDYSVAILSSSHTKVEKNIKADEECMWQCIVKQCKCWKSNVVVGDCGYLNIYNFSVLFSSCEIVGA